MTMTTINHVEEFARLTAELGEATDVAQGLALLLETIDGSSGDAHQNGLDAAAAIARMLNAQLRGTFRLATGLNDRRKRLVVGHEAPGDGHG